MLTLVPLILFGTIGKVVALQRIRSSHFINAPIKNVIKERRQSRSNEAQPPKAAKKKKKKKKKRRKNVKLIQNKRHILYTDIHTNEIHCNRGNVL